MQPLNVALVGLGWFGKIHLDAWRSVPNVRVVGVCDSRPDTMSPAARSAQEEFHVTAGHGSAAILSSAPVFSSIEQMLSAVSCDVVDVVTPEATHYEVALAALRAGKHVIIEKPFVTRSIDAHGLISAAAERERHVYVGNVLRFDARYQHAIEDLRFRGDHVRYISLQRHFQRSAIKVYGRVHPFFGACIHDIDVALWVKGAKPCRVMGTVTKSGDGTATDAAVGILHWGDGAVAIVQNSWHLPASCPTGFTFETSILTENRMVSIRSQPVVEVLGPDNYLLPEFFFWPSIFGERGGAVTTELRHFAACAVADRASEQVPVHQAAWGIEVAEALLQSVQQQRWVEL